MDVHSKELFVATSGNDGVTYANNDINNPWKSPFKAWEGARAGDTVYFREGTYVISSKIWTKNIGYNGTEVNPITFMPYRGDSVTIQSTIRGATIIIEKNWNVIKGFNVVFPVTMFEFSEDRPVSGGEVSGCTATMTEGGDNAGFVYIWGGRGAHLVERITVKNNVISGPGSGAHLNSAGVIVFTAKNVKILNNIIGKFPIGIYYKHSIARENATGFEVAYNYITNTSRYSLELNTYYAHIHNNIMGANNSDLRINEANGGPLGDWNTVEHNTLSSGRIILSADDDGANNNKIINNIMVGRTNCCVGNVWDYNIYKSDGGIGPHDLGHTVPTFSGGVHPSDILGYAIHVGSPGHRAGSDGKDIGVVDVNLVGRNPGNTKQPVKERRFL